MTLYLEVELRRDSLPGTEQNTSAGVAPIPPRPSLQLGSRARMPENISKNMKNPGNRAQTGYVWLDSFFSLRQGISLVSCVSCIPILFIS